MPHHLVPVILVRDLHLEDFARINGEELIARRRPLGPVFFRDHGPDRTHLDARIRGTEKCRRHEITGNETPPG